MVGRIIVPLGLVAEPVGGRDLVAIAVIGKILVHLLLRRSIVGQAARAGDVPLSWWCGIGAGVALIIGLVIADIGKADIHPGVHRLAAWQRNDVGCRVGRKARHRPGLVAADVGAAMVLKADDVVIGVERPLDLQAVRAPKAPRQRPPQAA